MKRILAALAMSAVPLSIHAVDWRKTCNNIEETAAVVMESRQQGIPMSSLMEGVAETMKGSMGLQEYSEAIIIAAYARPRHNSKENQRKSVDNFRNDIYLDCVKKVKHLQKD